MKVTVEDWYRIGLWTLCGPLLCIAIAVAYNGIVFAGDLPDIRHRAMMAAIVVPSVLGIPLFLCFSLKLCELAAVNRRLGVVAATDGLTNCLNRNAFAEMVDLRIENLLSAGKCPYGALLIVDADHFKQINDRFGHQHGDTALAAMAQAIRSSVRSGDSVGRLGGEEFGVFLPGVDRHAAQAVAERLRQSVEAVPFSANGERHRLSVSVGGVVFDGEARFSLLFPQADERLYLAKREGRNCVRLTSFEAKSPTLAFAEP